MKRQYKELAEVALRARRFAHAPFSKFKVGAALLTRSGKVFTGCNVENSSYGLSMCAERTALFKAISEGERNFVALAISADTDPLSPPCGACRQVMADLAPSIDVILVNIQHRTSVHTLKSLMPLAFVPKYLRSHSKKR